MIEFIRHKIFNKKLLNACLGIGVILLSGFLCIYPMFREGSLNRLIQSLFVENAEETGKFPMVLSVHEELLTVDVPDYEAINNIINEKTIKVTDSIICPLVNVQKIIYSHEDYVETTFGNRTIRLSYGTVPNLSEYSEVVFGTGYENADSSDNKMVKEAISKGAIPVVISEATMDKHGLSVGETLSFQSGITPEKGKLVTVITGIIAEKEDDNYYWNNRLSDYIGVIFMADDDYAQAVADGRTMATEVDVNLLFDYREINSNNIGRLTETLSTLHAEDDMYKDNFTELLTEYGHEERSISTILITFVLPIVALILLFLYMISARILEMETTEIAMLKSRGISRGRIIRLYILQSSVIAIICSALGAALGVFLCKLAAGTNAFLSFSLKDVSIYKPTPSMIIYMMIAFVLAVAFMTLPVISLSKLTITDRKNLRIGGGKIPGWEKFYIDLAILAITGYFLYNYNKQKEYMAVQIIEGKGIDPILFLDSSLFILGCGLLLLRLLGYLIRLVNYIGRKKWKPNTYVAFLQIIRNRKRQGFISVFLVMTVAMGIFNANLARTVNENMERRTEYNIGTDLQVKERWKLNVVKTNDGYLWSYREPDLSRFDCLNELGIEQKTRVIIDNNTDITIDRQNEKGHTLMAIQTKEFGEVASLDPNLNDMHWYNYLNELALNPNGVLISSNLAHKYDLKVGDKLTYSRYSPLDSTRTYVDVKPEIVGIIDSFPGFTSVDYLRNEQDELVTKDKYLIVANYATVVNNCYLTPYEVWMRSGEELDIREVRSRLDDAGIMLTGIVCKNDEIQTERNSAMIQITNGMFSIGFIISLLICAVGFLIYWILTIREREMLYGIYRAMGMSMREIINMLVIEQIFSSVLAVISGGAVGVITTALFAKLISIVYLPRKHNLPIEIYFRADDITKIAIIICITFGICFAVMSRTVRKMDIAKALKMGED